MPVWVYDATQRPCICHLDAAGARVDAQLGTNRACTSQGRVSSWGFRTTARVILSTHMPCAVECFGIMWLYMHPSRSPGRCGCKHLSDTDGTRVGARTVLMEHVHTICRCSMRVRVRRAHARRTAPCNRIVRMVPHRRRWGLCGCTHATHAWSTYIPSECAGPLRESVDAAPDSRCAWVNLCRYYGFYAGRLFLC
jgi:hypothetical protein